MAEPLVYFVAGPADDEDYAQAEYLAEMLMVSLPSIKCELLPIMPDAWPAYVAEKCVSLGCKQRAPLVWMSSGVVVGGFPEFAGECEKKYGVRIQGVDYSVWPKVAKENIAAAKKALANAPEPIIGSAGTGTGAARGEAVAEELITGNARYLETASGVEPSSSTRALGQLAEPAAVVVCLTPLPHPAHELLGCSAANLFVVPCTPIGIEPLAVGNAEHGAIALKAKAVMLLAAGSAEFEAHVQATRDARLAKDAPLPSGQSAVLQHMLPALARVLAVAPPRCTAAEVTQLCLEEYVRESADELLAQSPVLAQLHARAELHIERAVCGSNGALSIV